MRVLFLSGPTASGKSQMAIQIAKKFSAEILNCDSIQVYKGLDIGSAKPSPQEMKEVPHHLFSFVEKGKKYTAGDFEKDAFSVIENSNAPLMIVVGGTGFYFQALEKGMYEGEKTSSDIKESVKEELKEKGLGYLYETLKKEDPDYAKKIASTDTYRITRAMEVLKEGKLPSKLQSDFQKRDFPYPLLKLGIKLDRALLRDNVEKRVEQMLEMGFQKEVEGLINEGYEDWSAMNSVDYKEMKQFLKGKLSLEKLKEEMVTKTMQLAKKQRTWFQRDKEIHWISPESKMEAINIVSDFLNKEEK